MSNKKSKIISQDEAYINLLNKILEQPSDPDHKDKDQDATVEHFNLQNNGGSIWLDEKKKK